MKSITYTLLSDGSSDRALMPILTWLLNQHLPNVAIQAQWADRSRWPSPGEDLLERIPLALHWEPCHLLFVHRDVEKQSWQERVTEIRAAITKLTLTHKPVVCVVPVRMTEAWLLGSVDAIRAAAGNEAGDMSLTIPAATKIELLPSPKQLLLNLLQQASGLSGRRLRDFRAHQRIHDLADRIDHFEYLRVLPAFQRLEAELRSVIEQLNV